MPALDHQCVCVCASNHDLRFVVMIRMIRKVTEYSNKVSDIRCRGSVCVCVCVLCVLCVGVPGVCYLFLINTLKINRIYIKLYF